jgi:quercetin dioxygenase-like cupin family protein
MSPTNPYVRRGGEIEYEPVDAADGLRKGVLVGEADGGGTLALRRFTLAPGSEVPRHTNEIEHEQYVLAGEYTVGISEAGSEDGGTEYTVREGDAIHVPAGAVHWYRNEGDEEGAFLCAVPTGDDEIQLVGEAAGE